MNVDPIWSVDLDRAIAAHVDGWVFEICPDPERRDHYSCTLLAIPEPDAAHHRAEACSVPLFVQAVLAYHKELRRRH